MKDKDSQLIFEKYQQIQEASPIGLGQRFGNWAKRKIAAALPTFTGDWGHRLAGEKQAQTEIIKLKQQFERFKGQFRLQKDNVQSRHLFTFLKNNGIDENINAMKSLKKNPNMYLDDNEVNTFINDSYQEQLETGLYSTPPTNQPATKPSTSITNKKTNKNSNQPATKPNTNTAVKRGSTSITPTTPSKGTRKTTRQPAKKLGKMIVA